MSSTRNNVRPLVSPRQPVEAARASFQGTLALELDRDLAPPWLPDQPPQRGADVVAVSPPTRQDLHRWIVTFAQACVEVIGGDRPASQLIRWTSPQVHTEVAYRAGVVGRAGVHAAGHGRGRRPTVRSQVQTVHTCFLADDVVEFCVRVKHGERNRFMAGRLDVVTARWQCTALEFG